LKKVENSASRLIEPCWCPNRPVEGGGPASAGWFLPSCWERSSTPGQARPSRLRHHERWVFSNCGDDHRTYI
jgi:hypothetical protein